jgi:purine-binding chemotaxis protein CheW
MQQAAASLAPARSPEPDRLIQLLLFRVDGRRFALNLESVERIIRAVELEPVPGLPRVIRGLFSLHGQIVPVGDLRRRLGWPEKDISLGDRIVILRTPARLLGLLVDGDTDISQCRAQDALPAPSIFREAGLVEGVVTLPEGLVLIQNLAKFLSLEEELVLTEALDAAR